MTASRSRKQNKTYRDYINTLPKDATCQFCEINQESSQFVSGSDDFKVIRNIFGYSIWDSQKVSDHLMIVPVQHTDTLADISPKAAQEFVKLISQYEQEGYNVYARAPGSNMKSVIHQHTHLIKLGGTRVRAFLHLRKPYVRIAI